MLPVATKRQAHGLWTVLEQELGERVGLVAGGVKRTGFRLLVGTVGGIPFDSAGSWDVMLLPYGVQCTGNVACKLIAKLAPRSLYACVTPTGRVDAQVELLLEMIAGPVIVALDRPEAAIKVVMLPSSSSQVSGAISALAWKRLLYWKNRARNQHVADVAKAVVDKDRKRLRGLGIAKGIVGDDIQVAILVESVEHAGALRSLLPGWMISAETPTGAIKANKERSALPSPTGNVKKQGARDSHAEGEEKDASECASTSKVAKKIEGESKVHVKSKSGTKKHAEVVLSEGAEKIETSTSRTSRARIEKVAPDGDSSPSIVTVTYASKYGIQADVLIRATGTDSPLRLESLSSQSGRPTPTLVIDFHDSCHPRAVRDTARRLQDYGRRGMVVLVVNEGDNQITEGTRERNPSGRRRQPQHVEPEVGLVSPPGGSVQQREGNSSAPSRLSGRRK